MREMKEQLNVTKVTLCLLFGKRGSVIIEF